MKTNTHFRLHLGILITCIMAVFSCSDAETDPNPKPDNNGGTIDPDIAINDWIQEIMDDYYYWNSQMKDPIANDADPENYFDALLVDQDRFSIIYPNYEDLTNSLSGIRKEAGYEFMLFRESQSNQNVIAVILYIKKGSPAEAAGLKRDDVIKEINGLTMTLGNYQNVLEGIEDAHTLTIERYDEKANDGAGDYVPLTEPVELSTVELTENPIFMDSVYTVSDKKIGYLIYHFFTPGEELNPDDGTTFGAYDQQLDDIFTDFKAKGITDLIVDLRYNGGGYVSSAVNLASLIGLGVTSEDIFYKTKYNTGLQTAVIQAYGADFLIRKFTDKPQNIGNQLYNGTVYIIGTDQTASASELIINGLMPYMTVKLIGETTYGKNVGSTTFQDEESESNHYGLLPIISQSFNSLDKSDYSDGFVPDVESNEFDNGRLLPLGDINETMLKVAIGQITGEGSSSRKVKIERSELGNSLENKIRFGKMIEQPIQLR